MLRVAMSVVAVLLIAAFGYLLFSGYFHAQQQSSKDMLGTPLPPAAPITPAPPPIQPVVHQPPVSPVPAPVPAPAPAPVVERPAAPVATPEPRAVRRTHVVQSGDSLSSISQKYFNTPNYYGKIATANGLKNKDRIRVGQVLLLPDVAAVEVKPVATPSEDSPAKELHTDDFSSSVDLKDFEPMPPTLSVPRPAPKN